MHKCRGHPMHTREDPAESSMVATPHPPTPISFFSSSSSSSFSSLSSFFCSSSSSYYFLTSLSHSVLHTLPLLSFHFCFHLALFQPPPTCILQSLSSIIVFSKPLKFPSHCFPFKSPSPFPPLQYPSPPNSTTRWFLYGGGGGGGLEKPSRIPPTPSSLPSPYHHCNTTSKSQRCTVGLLSGLHRFVEL